MQFVQEVREGGHYDIIVAGGGVAGTAAAIQAGRAGKRVLLIEKSIKLGGLATLGLVNLFVPMCNGRGKQIIFGMCEEMLRLSIEHGWGDARSDFVNGRIPQEKLDAYAREGKQPPRYACRFSAEIFALELTKMCRDAGVELMFDTILARPICEKENGRTVVKGIIVENKSGASYYTADFFVDATGDSDLLCRAGIPTAERGNFHTFYGFTVTLDTCRAALEAGNIEKVYGRIAGGNANLYGGGHPENVPLYYGTRAEEVNRYCIDNQLEMLAKLKAEDRKKREIVTVPGMCQFRTTRRIVGDYNLQESDVYRHFEDSVGAINDFDRRDYLFEIPYRTLINSCAANVITCGRTAAGDGYAWDVLRVIPPAIISGQAAGLACSLAMDSGRVISEVDVPALQKKLEAANVMIHFDDADIPEKSDSTIEHND